MKTLLLFAGALIGSVASAKCLDNKLVERATAPFEITRWDGQKQSEALHLKDLCNEEDVLYKVADALILTLQIQDEAGGPVRNSDSVVAQEGPFNFFKTRIEKIVIEDVAALPRGACVSQGVVAYVRGGDGKRTFICADMFKTMNNFSGSTTLVHESRHVEGYGHAHCGHGILHNQDLDTSGGCDTDYPSQGSYGVEAGFKVHIMNLTKDPVMKQQARAEAVSDFVSRFNEFPWDLKPGVITLSRQYNILKRHEPFTLSFFDGQNITPVNGMPTEDVVMTSRYGIPTFYAADGKVQSYNYAPQLTDTTGTMAQDYRTKSTPSERNELLDVYYSVEYSCRLYTNALKCESMNAQNQELGMSLQLNSLKPYAIVEASDKYSSSVKRYLVDENGDRYELPSKKEQLPNFTENNLVKADASDVRVLGLVRTDGDSVYAIDDSKHLIQPVSSTWEKVPQFKGQKVDKIIPFTWSKRLEGL